MEKPASAARQASWQASAGRRRTRNGSSHHSAYISGRMTAAAPTTDQRRLGKIVNRKAAISAAGPGFGAGAMGWYASLNPALAMTLRWQRPEGERRSRSPHHVIKP